MPILQENRNRLMERERLMDVLETKMSSLVIFSIRRWCRLLWLHLFGMSIGWLMIFCVLLLGVIGRRLPTTEAKSAERGEEGSSKRSSSESSYTSSSEATIAGLGCDGVEVAASRLDGWCFRL